MPDDSSSSRLLTSIDDEVAVGSENRRPWLDDRLSRLKSLILSIRHRVRSGLPVDLPRPHQMVNVEIPAERVVWSDGRLGQLCRLTVGVRRSLR